MKKLIFYCLICCAPLVSCTQPQKTEPQNVTTFILVRHAEKADDGTNDPGLTDEGTARANALTQLLGSTKVDAIYSTPFKRTTETVEPLAKEKNLTIQNYSPMKGEEMDKMLSDNKGGTIVISGHSNTTPWVANYFSGENKISDFKDSDYDNILIVSIVEKGNAKVTWINYGKPTE
ncbi:MAG: phosphoglycerate mutase family protein [Cyclobacteriaceae bacterium]